MDTEIIELKEGVNLQAEFKNFVFKDKKNKNLNLFDEVKDKSTVIALVKPGCVFCEAWLAVSNTTRPQIAPKLVVVIDAEHASPEAFAEMVSKFSRLNATWLYDSNNSFHSRLAVDSFPRFLHIDKEQKLIKQQAGLVVPENKAELEKQEFSFVLQKLAINTNSWLKTLQ